MWVQLCRQIFCKFQNVVIWNSSSCLNFLITIILKPISARAVKHLSFAFGPPLPAKTSLFKGNISRSLSRAYVTANSLEKLICNLFQLPNLINEVLIKNLIIYRKEQQSWANFPKHTESYRKFNFFGFPILTVQTSDHKTNTLHIMWMY